MTADAWVVLTCRVLVKNTLRDVLVSGTGLCWTSLDRRYWQCDQSFLLVSCLVSILDHCALLLARINMDKDRWRHHNFPLFSIVWNWDDFERFCSLVVDFIRASLLSQVLISILSVVSESWHWRTL